MKSQWALNARGQNTETCELDLYDVIGRDPLFGGGVGASDVLNALNAAPKAKSVLCRINSAGGIVTEGLAIFNLLNQCKASVTCRVDALAGSIASIIAMAGTLEMAEHSYLMIHNPWGWVEGRSSELRHQADVLDSMRSEMIAIYCAKSGKSPEFIGALMDEETWITATQALAYGLCDRLVPDSNAKLAAHYDLSLFRNTPRSLDASRQPNAQVTHENLKDAVAAAFADAALVAATEQTTQTTAAADVTVGTTESEPLAVTPAASGDTVMDEEQYKARIAELEAKLAEISAKLAETETARATAEAEAIEAKAKFKKKGEGDDDDDEDEDEMARSAVIAEVIELTGCKDVNKLLGALVAFGQNTKAKKSKETIAIRVSALIASGKMRPAMKAKALKMTEAQLDGYEEMIGDATVGPIGTEHEPDAAHATVVAAVAAGTAQVATFNPESVQLDADELHYCKVRDEFGTDGFVAKFLEEKRAKAKAEFIKKNPRAAVAA